ncbi:bifunctional heparan sulfate N-deacetylase/N-sulfotransferase isoform X1 [Lingula anatina]|uniref:[heparan sulfate]-glucosamine N-sulfotransferase n=1 Tax=Lingula anatina TaxID=7574 RepID=A0A1S3K230_LINAN|nr:bifunctional heparan sulfate N-deacetylase/N-sulfotransferase isoform X1 [Lingula anatina]XP_013416454.1 bifunctional heparan sulfate N-deacetylase/N-sulfotransferase isoform X1 [Lingula anatina]|eukprot:XP_013416453.1 bifunctional heparan sulfate N-deacetylase/N-sulfotransferase isoform X1 [Lingula anatina]
MPGKPRLSSTSSLLCLTTLPRICPVKKFKLTRLILGGSLLLGAVLLWLSYNAPFSNSKSAGERNSPPVPHLECQGRAQSIYRDDIGIPPRDHDSDAKMRINNHVLVLVETQYSRLGQEIVAILEAARIKFRVEPTGKSLPYLTHMDKGKFGVIVFENLEAYTNMDKWNRQLLDKYCKEYHVGMIIFAPSKEDGILSSQVEGFQLYIHTNLVLKDYKINPHSNILRLTRAGETWQGDLPDEDWTVFIANHSTYQPLAYASIRMTDHYSYDSVGEDVKQVVVLQDLGLCDGIQRVFFGNGFKFWLHRLLFLDSLSYLSHGKLSLPLERYILLDVDDIFVGRNGIRMHADDVEAMVLFQERWQKQIPNFHFNLGFSAKYFHHGTPEEDLGDDRLLEHKSKFWWFDHMWQHTQPHKYSNQSHLEADMAKNCKFAQERGIPVEWNYAIAPHHSGVYPIHEQLYEAWKKIWNIKVTSTEEYPHLKPARHRRGFIHRGIKVLPRQTCGLFTHTLFLNQYPGGRQRLENSIRGGDLFQTIVINPINIFMTHMSNYGSDRLALYTFESVFKFVQCWTNLKLLSAPPTVLAEKYFSMYPEEADPFWQNPCEDPRHREIWFKNKTCDRLPRFLVIGPQKTGTTALYSFLSMHPAITSNAWSPETFEEVQFFSGNNYYKGLDWYMQFFPPPVPGTNISQNYLFEKSASYFDKERVPMRAHALLPKSKLICILISPVKRAYSWYQHMRAHNDSTALRYSFYEVVTAKDDAPKALRDQRNRCLVPGMYAQHIDRWLQYYNVNQLLILDGELLKTNPVIIMHKVQRFLHIEPYFDYSMHLRYDSKKGFYCQVVNGDHTKCLGRSKGRKYPPMDSESEKFLQQYYKRHNVALSKMLHRLGLETPSWLEEDLRNFE